eukprot:gene28281-35036_t
MDQLAQLKAITVVSADTADLDAVEALKPQDATTNPTFIAAIASSPKYASLVEEAATYAKEKCEKKSDALELALDRLAVNLGKELAKRVPGFVSTEVDARQSFSIERTVQRAKRIIDMYEADGIPRDRVLIKASDTERQFPQENFSSAASFASTNGIVLKTAPLQVGAMLISPFVGRMMDWHKKTLGVDSFAPAEDPGVVSVARIYAYYKTHGYNTIVMGASFRNLDEIKELAGVDRLTVSPK